MKCEILANRYSHAVAVNRLPTVWLSSLVSFIKIIRIVAVSGFILLSELEKNGELAEEEEPQLSIQTRYSQFCNYKKTPDHGPTIRAMFVRDGH